MLTKFRDLPRSEQPGVTAVVVTCNRLALLKECLAAIEAQTYKVDSIVVVDNASSDGTGEYLRNYASERLHFETLERNSGGAGGFAHGLRMAARLSGKLLWLMDDDCIADPDALETLMASADVLDHADQPYSFLCSRVHDTFGAICNHPVPSAKPNASGWPQWADLADKGLILVEECTFVSVLVPLEYVRRAGLPYEEMFIWGDDTEYTRRLSCHAPGVFVLSSQVLHKRQMRGELSVHNESSRTRLSFYRFFFRNRVFVYRRYMSTPRYGSLLLRFSWDFLRLLGKGQFDRAMLVARGIVEGLFFSPKLQFLDEVPAIKQAPDRHTATRARSDA